ncbi:EAL domain-containing protein [Noviherbaspirillum galbum]|uniref:GGDEF domain-containing protein n=1 Tax=Noviherbaspirillum galbum TaxID=2709383 RepID=A0A6B3SR50_9BURK|nr:EAL domain-containing protein [Noviherbaspirillum galbum]NEX60139.1 GGDEF domain-containing protein [Noviherbaspirillum galbum]
MSALPTPSRINALEASVHCLDRLADAVSCARGNNTRVAVYFVAANAPVLDNSVLPAALADRLLAVLRQCVGPEGDCAQYSGGSFIAFIPSAGSITEAAAKMHVIQAGFLNVLRRGESGRVLVGASVFPEDDTDSSGLLMHAYSAMLDNLLTDGQYCNLFNFAKQAEESRRNRVTSDVLRALNENRIRAYFQPKVNIVTGLPTGAEALARLIKEDGTVMEPGHFLPYIKSERCLLELDCAMLEQALRQGIAWMDEGMPLAMSVNVAAKLFNNRLFTERALVLLEKYPRFPPAMLAIEVLENLDMTDLALARGLFAELRAHGVRIYLDDYGTGRSSAAYMKAFEVDGIKIDRSFVGDLCNGARGERDRAIIAAAVEVARAFGLRYIIAEGIEQEDTAKALVDLGITTGQGYFYARPMPAEKFRDWFHDAHQSYQSS